MLKQFHFDKVTVMTLVLAPLAYMVVYAVLFTDGYTDEIKAVVVGAILGKLLPDLASYWFDSTAREASKDDAIAESPRLQVDVPAQTIDALPPKGKK